MAGGIIRGFRPTTAPMTRERYGGLIVATVLGGAREAAVCPSAGKRVSGH